MAVNAKHDEKRNFTSSALVKIYCHLMQRAYALVSIPAMNLFSINLPDTE